MSKLDLTPDNHDDLIHKLLGTLESANEALDRLTHEDERLFDLAAVLRKRTAQVIKSNAKHDARYVGNRSATPTRKFLARLASRIRVAADRVGLGDVATVLQRRSENDRERIAVQLACVLGLVAHVSPDHLRVFAAEQGWAPQTGWRFQWLPPAIAKHEPLFEGYILANVLATYRFEPGPLGEILRRSLDNALRDANAPDACLAWLETFGATTENMDWRHGLVGVDAIAVHLPNATPPWEERACRAIAQLGYEESALGMSLRFAPRDAARALLERLPHDTPVALRGWLLVAAEQPDVLLGLVPDTGTWSAVRWRAHALAMTGQTKEALLLVEGASVDQASFHGRRELLHELYLRDGRGEEALRHHPIRDFSIPSLQKLADKYGVSVQRVFQIGAAKSRWFRDREAVYAAVALGLEEEALAVAPTSSPTVQPFLLADLIGSAPVKTKYEQRLRPQQTYHWLILDETIRQAIEDRPGIVMRFAVQALQELLDAWHREPPSDFPAARAMYLDLVALVGDVVSIGRRAAALADRVDEWTEHVNGWMSRDNPTELSLALESATSESTDVLTDEKAEPKPEVAEPKPKGKTVGIGVRRRRRRK